MSEAAGLVNVYVCDTCGCHTVTKNRDEGTTSFMISCRVTADCHGSAFSSFYRVNQRLEPTILWIKPTPDELEAFLIAQADKGPGLAAAIKRHVSMGGLLDVAAPPTLADVLADMDKWLSNSEGLMIEDVIAWREMIAAAIGAEPLK